MYQLDGKVALVTAAAGDGIGGATARRLLDEGATVIVTDAHEGRLNKATAAMKDTFGERVHSRLLDVASRPQINDVIAWSVAQFSCVDILVNNAGINVPGPIGSTSPEDWDHVMAVDLDGPWYISRSVLPAMLEKGAGSIVNISSPAGSLSGSGEGAYAAAKAGLEQLTRTIASDYGSSGIRCNAVAPGIVETRYIKLNAERMEPRRAQTPLRRFGRPEEVAAIVAFLASDEAPYVTGEVIWATGGLFMRG